MDGIKSAKNCLVSFSKEKTTIVFITGFLILPHSSFGDYQDWIPLESVEKY